MSRSDFGQLANHEQSFHKTETEMCAHLWHALQWAKQTSNADAHPPATSFALSSNDPSVPWLQSPAPFVLAQKPARGGGKRRKEGGERSDVASDIV